jgi:hypothetical protein
VDLTSPSAMLGRQPWSPRSPKGPPRSAQLAFLALRADLRERVFAGRIDLWVVVPAKGRQFVIANSWADAGRKAAAFRGARGPAWVVPLLAAIEQSRQRYGDLVAELADETATVTPLRAEAEGG